MASKLVT